MSFELSDHLILGLYKSPNIGSDDQLCQAIDKVLGQWQHHGDKVIIIGDFNIDLMKKTISKTKRLVQWMGDRGFTSHDLGPTTRQITAIDHLWANCPLGQPTMAMYCFFSDHKKLLVTLTN